MHTTHVVLVSLLALIFLISGLSKASGNPKGLSGTRDVNVPNQLARFIGAWEALAALALVIGLRATFIQWGALIVLWVTMGGAIYAHFRAEKVKTAVPAFILLTLISIALVTI
ncbi:MAG: DoxX family protein [Actinobacteria bacterium]|nr:DoxX family protein [Actinomycetota bacterium]